MDIGSSLREAQQALERGNTLEARAKIDAVLESHPGVADAWFLRGCQQLQSRKPEEAISSFERAAKLEPPHVQSQFQLTRLYREAGNLPAAMAAAVQLVKSPSILPVMSMEAALSLLAGGALGLATTCFKAARKDPQLLVPATYHLVNTWDNMGRKLDALKVLEQTVAQVDHPMLWYQLGNLRLWFGDTSGSAEAALRAQALDPHQSDIHVLLARAYGAAGQEEQSAKYWSMAESSSPKPAGIVAGRGYLAQTAGHFEEGERELRRSYALDPSDGNALSLLFRSRKVTTADHDLIRQAEATLSGSSLTPTSRRYFHYALGKARHDLGEFDAAMKHYDAANALTAEIPRSGKWAELADVKSLCSDFKRVFTKERLERWRHAGSPSPKPAFVVGRIRSGTTLAEHILSSHPDVTGAGELAFWPAHSKLLIDFDRRTLNEPALKEAAADYLRQMDHIDSSAKRVTDKYPANLLYAGLLHVAFPEAKILCIHRRAIDVALSIWFTPMTTDAAFFHDKGAICESLRLHDDMMRHWQTVLPPSAFKVIHYEDLILDREAQTREMIEFLGLQWNEACLSPETNRREVLTPSMWQVRQSVYSTSIDRWKPYDGLLGEFSQLLGDVERG